MHNRAQEPRSSPVLSGEGAAEQEAFPARAGLRAHLAGAPGDRARYLGRAVARR